MKEYFSHDYNARDDEKMPKLLSEVGYEGYGIYWAVVEMLYKNEGYMQMDCKSIAFALHCDSICLTKVLNDFDLFVNDNGKFYSESVLKRLGIRKDISEKRSNAAKIKWNANAEQKDNKSNAIKEKKRKENESKVKEINNNGWSADEPLHLGLLKNYPKLFKMKDSLKYYEHNKLVVKFSVERVKSIYEAMQNKSDLLKKYDSAYLTANNWLSREVKK